MLMRFIGFAGRFVVRFCWLLLASIGFCAILLVLGVILCEVLWFYGDFCREFVWIRVNSCDFVRFWDLLCFYCDFTRFRVILYAFMGVPFVAWFCVIWSDFAWDCVCFCILWGFRVVLFVFLSFCFDFVVFRAFFLWFIMISCFVVISCGLVWFQWDLG